MQSRKKSERSARVLETREFFRRSHTGGAQAECSIAESRDAMSAMQCLLCNMQGALTGPGGDAGRSNQKVDELDVVPAGCSSSLKFVARKAPGSQRGGRQGLGRGGGRAVSGACVSGDVRRGDARLASLPLAGSRRHPHERVPAALKGIHRRHLGRIGRAAASTV